MRIENLMVSMGGGLLVLQECAGVKGMRVHRLVNCTWRLCSDSRWQVDAKDLEQSLAF